MTATMEPRSRSDTETEPIANWPAPTGSKASLQKNKSVVSYAK